MNNDSNDHIIEQIDNVIDDGVESNVIENDDTDHVIKDDDTDHVSVDGIDKVDIDGSNDGMDKVDKSDAHIEIKNVNEHDLHSISVDSGKLPRGEGWTPEIEVYLHNISLKCVTFKNIHEKSAISFTKSFNYFSLFLIFVSFLASLVTVIPINHQTYNYITAIFTILTSALATTNKFLQWQEISTKHKIGAQKFLQLNENITSQILTEKQQRINALQYIRWAGKTFNDIRKSLPFPPDKILQKLNIDSQPDIELKDIYNKPQHMKDNSNLKSNSTFKNNIKRMLSKKNIYNIDNSHHGFNGGRNDLDLERNIIQLHNLNQNNSSVRDIEQQSKYLQDLQLLQFKYSSQKFQT